MSRHHDTPINPARKLFGQVFLAWREANGLKQGDIQAWTNANFPKNKERIWGRVNNSQISDIETVSAIPKISFFYGLAKFNKDLAKSKFLEIPKKDIRAKLVNAEPFTDDNGKVYGITEWFAFYVGETQPPSKWEVISEAEAVTLSKAYCTLFESFQVDHELTKREAWTIIGERLDKHQLSKELKSKVLAVIDNLDDYTPKEAQALKELEVGASLFS
tara:strand:+ start:529 stop:1179 length:651 start_codon:yes stop_codon:yes gene_type:complete